MFELISQKYMKESDITINLLYYELYGKITTSLDVSYSLLKNNHLLSNIFIGKIDTTTSTIVKDMEIVINDLTVNPTAQITGYPVNMTCNILHSPPYYPLDGLFVILSFQGLEEKGYLSSHSLISVLASIDTINKEVYILFHFFYLFIIVSCNG